MRLSSWLWAALAALLGGAATGCATFVPPERGGAQWHEVASSSVTVWSELDPKESQEVAHKIQRMAAAEQAALWPQLGTTLKPFGVVALRTQDELQELQPNAVGFAIHDPWHDTLVVAGDSDQWDSIALHEISHVLIRQTLGHVPQWLNEGMATYVEAFHLQPGSTEVRFGGVPSRWADARDHWMLPMSRLWQGLPNLEDPRDSDSFYKTSWLAVHMLINRYPAGWQQLLTLMAGGMDARHAWAQTFPTLDDAAMDRELQVYRRTGTYTEYALRLSVSGLSPRVRDLSPAEVHVVRARLLLGVMNGTPEARFKELRSKVDAELAAALALDPSQPEALWLSTPSPRAPPLAACREAMRRHPQNVHTWIALAAAQPEGSAQALAAAEQAAKIAPSDPEALAALARAQESRGLLDLAASTLATARATAPANAILMALSARLAARLGHCDEARARASQSAATRELAKSFLDNVNEEVAKCHPVTGAPQ